MTARERESDTKKKGYRMKRIRKSEINNYDKM